MLLFLWTLGTLPLCRRDHVASPGSQELPRKVNEVVRRQSIRLAICCFLVLFHQMGLMVLTCVNCLAVYTGGEHCDKFNVMICY